LWAWQGDACPGDGHADAGGRRAAPGLAADEQILDLLPRVAAVGAQNEASIQRLVTLLRERRVTWARIGTALQITRQSAWERTPGGDQASLSGRSALSARPSPTPPGRRAIRCIRRHQAVTGLS
jgi:hypothetical protein